MNTTRGRRSERPIVPANEMTIWDVYNNLADVRDDELIKDWKDNLNSVLLFASIFAAVLTPLVIESMKLLKEDQQETSNALLRCIYTQIRNDSASECTVRQFEVPRRAVVVNNALFLSLFFSIVAALIATLALQWGNEYSSSVSTSNMDTRKRALVRHFRYLGMEKWGMRENLAMLPVLLHAAVLLFFGGMVIWLVDVNPVIHKVCVGGLLGAFMASAIPAFIAALDGNAPFRSPMARSLRIFLHLQVFNILRIVYYLIRYFSGWEEAIRSPICAAMLETLGKMLTRLVGRLLTPSIEETATEGPSLELQVMTWTASQLDITRQPHRRVLCILGQAAALLKATPDLPGPWDNLFMHLNGSHMDDSITWDASYHDARFISMLLEIWTTFRSRSTLAASEETYHYSLDDKRTVFSLISPLEISEAPSKVDMELVIKLIQLNMAPPEYLYLQAVEDALARLLDGTRLPNASVMRFAVSSLSIYLWTHGSSSPQHRLLNLLGLIFKACVIPLSKRDTYRICSVLCSSVVGSQHETHISNGPGSHREDSSQVIRIGINLQSLRVIHSAIMIHFLDNVIDCQEAGAAQTQAHLRHICRFLAHIPTIQNSNDPTVRRAQRIIDCLPHFMEPGHDHGFTAMASLVWLADIKEVPHVHRYLASLLSSRKKFPLIPPMWRDWSHQLEMERYLGPSHCEMEWITALQSDRRFTELLAAFDGLIDDGCSKEQRLVMIDLAIDHLSYYSEFDCAGYYTDRREQTLKALHDPALRLIGARAASIGYTGAIPTRDHPLWNDEGWITAAIFWCATYEDTDILADTALLSAAITQHNTMVISSIVNRSSKDQRLQARLRAVLESTRYNEHDPHYTLLLHTTLCDCSWYSNYLQSPGVIDELLKIAETPQHVDLRVLSFLASMISSIEQQRQLCDALGSILRILETSGARPCPNGIQNVHDAFDRILLETPPWLRAMKSDLIDEWVLVTGQIGRIKCLLGAGERDACSTDRPCPRGESLS